MTSNFSFIIKPPGIPSYLRPSHRIMSRPTCSSGGVRTLVQQCSGLLYPSGIPLTFTGSNTGWVVPVDLCGTRGTRTPIN